MPCIAVPVPTIPTIPAPFTLGATQPPTVTFDPAACCQLLPAPISSPPVPLPPQILNPAFIAAINQATQQVTAALRAIAFNCPRN